MDTKEQDNTKSLDNDLSKDIDASKLDDTIENKKNTTSESSLSSSSSSSIPVAKEDKGEFLPLPSLLSLSPLKSLNKSFIVEGSKSVEITSVDVAPHGCFVLAGCGNGIVLLFDLSSQSKYGHVIGFIEAKGLHTNLLVTVKFSPDGRFAFAGVSKGSMELLAIDLGNIPIWNKEKFKKYSIESMIVTHKRSDPKLRGFGAVVRVPDEKTITTTYKKSAQYRLACGRGIKNVHIWQFFPDAINGAEWRCIYDVASNGNTIETITFRSDGQEVLSKSAGVCLRIWDISSFENDVEAKASFNDIPNSQDVQTMVGNYGFGGVYNFAIVKLDAPKAANRDHLEIPERSSGDSASNPGGNRRRRMMREIKDVRSTTDGMHVMAICSDGGFLYYRNNCTDNNGTEADDGKNYDSTMKELPIKQIDGGDCQAWTIGRVGAEGMLLFVRVIVTGDECVLETSLISDEVPEFEKLAREKWDLPLVSSSTTPLSHEITTTSTPTNISTYPQSWNRWGYYYDPTAMAKVKVTKEKEKEQIVVADVAETSNSKTSTTKSVASSNKNSSSKNSSSKNSSSTVKRSTSNAARTPADSSSRGRNSTFTGTVTKAGSRNNNVTPHGETFQITPSTSRKSHKNSSNSDVYSSGHATEVQSRYTSSIMGTPVLAAADPIDWSTFARGNPPKKYLHLNKVPHIARTKESTAFISKERSDKQTLSLSQLESLENIWIENSKKIANKIIDCNCTSNSDSSYSGNVNIFVHDLANFYIKYAKDVAWTMRQKYVHLNQDDYTHTNHVNGRYKQTLDNLLQRHALENNYCNNSNSSNNSNGESSLLVLHQGFEEAIKYDSQIHKLFVE